MTWHQLVAQLLSWSSLLTVIGFVVLWITGRHRWGWLLGIGWEALWIVYGVASQQLPFAASGVVFTCIFLRNYLTWPKAHPK